MVEIASGFNFLFVSLEAMGDLLVTPNIFAMTPNERLGMHK